jgi:hypothetical protein
MLFKPRTIHEPFVQTQYIEKMDKKKGQPNGCKQKGHQDTFEEGNEKWKEKDKKTIATTHQCKDPRNHYNYCNIDGDTNEKC